MKGPHTPSRERIGHFMQNDLERVLDPSLIREVYPVTYHRLVFRYGEGRVLKIRPEKDDRARHGALDEANNLQQLLSFYNTQGYPFQTASRIIETNGFMVIEMPYMGENINHLLVDLDMRDRGEHVGPDGFVGFTLEHAQRLAHQFKGDLELFLSEWGYIHCDLFPDNQGPNNIVYNKEFDRLLIIDAEALAHISSISRRTLGSAQNQIKLAIEWILGNMIVK